MKIESRDSDVGSILAGAYFKIPRYQRPYSWEREQVEEFWEDTIQNAHGDYFIGSVVVFKGKGDTAHSIVDGQQRFTTITMVLCALRNALTENGSTNLADGVHTLVERRDLTNKLKYVLQTETSYPYLQEYIQKPTSREVDIELGDEERHLKAAFELISAKVDAEVTSIRGRTSLNAKQKNVKTVEALEGIRDTLLGLKIILVELDNEDDAYFVFETLNTRGKDLQVQDIVKNHITRLKKPTNAGVDVARDKWNAILETFEKSAANLRMDAFLHHYWLSREDFVAQKKLFKRIKSRVNRTNIDAFLDNLVEDSRTYRIIHEPDYRKGGWSVQERVIRSALDALNLFRVRMSVPMILSVLREKDAGGLNQKHVRETLLCLESFHFVFNAVAGQRATGGSAGMFASHARQLHVAKPKDKLSVCRELRDKLRDRLPPLDEFVLGFREIMFTDRETKQKALVRYILGKIAAHLGNQLDMTLMTIEHIAPQSSASSADAIGQLGNLILVSEKVNQKLGSKTFPAKKRILEKSNISLDEFVASRNRWDTKAIEDHTKWLASLAYKKIWKV